MALDEDGNFDFTDEPGKVYVVPDDHIYVHGIRVWRNMDENGKLCVYWHVDADGVTVTEIVGLLEMVKLSIAQQQIADWNEDQS